MHAEANEGVGSNEDLVTVEEENSKGSEHSNETLAEKKGKEVEEPKQTKLWVDVTNENRNPTRGLTMECVAPKVVDGAPEIVIEAMFVESEILYWDYALIMYVIRGILVCTLSRNIWRSYGTL